MQFWLFEMMIIWRLEHLSRILWPAWHITYSFPICKLVRREYLRWALSSGKAQENKPEFKWAEWNRPCQLFFACLKLPPESSNIWELILCSKNCRFWQCWLSSKIFSNQTFPSWQVSPQTHSLEQLSLFWWAVSWGSTKISFRLADIQSILKVEYKNRLSWCDRHNFPGISIESLKLWDPLLHMRRFRWECWWQTPN